MAKSAAKTQNIAWWLRGDVIAAGVFVLALIIRLIFIHQWYATPYGAVPLLDASAYDAWAEDILHGHWLRERAFYQSPLYPYLLAILYAIFGHTLWVASLFNALLGAGTCAVLSAIAIRIFNPPAGLATGLLAAFYKPFILYAAPVMKENLGLFLLALFVIAALMALRRNRMRDYVLAGLLLGLAALVRGNVLLLGIVVLTATFLRLRRESLWPCVLFITAVMVMILPATLHNAIVSHDFVPLTYNDGFNFAIGNSAGADAADGGINAYPAGISSDPLFGEEHDTARIAAQALGHAPKPSEVSRYWFRRGSGFIEQNPGTFLIRLADKVRLFWNNYEVPDNYDPDFIAGNFDTIMCWPLPGFGLIAALAVFTLVASGRRQKTGTLFFVALSLTYMLSVILFYVSDRYRLPVVIFLLPLAGAAPTYAWQVARDKNVKCLGIASLAMIAVFTLTHIGQPQRKPVVAAHDWAMISWIDYKEEHYMEALAALQKALALDPAGAGSAAFISGSYAAEQLGRRDVAAQLLRQAMDLYPRWGPAYYYYGRLKAEEGDLAAALEYLNKAAALTPDDPLTFIGLARLYIKTGDIPRARDAIYKGLMLDPASDELHALLRGLPGE